MADTDEHQSDAYNKYHSGRMRWFIAKEQQSDTYPKSEEESRYLSQIDPLVLESITSLQR